MKNGFDQEMLKGLLELPEDAADGRLSLGVRRRELAKTEAQWASPEIVLSVKFSEWTDEDRIRAPVFMGVNTDVDPAAVWREWA